MTRGYYVFESKGKVTNAAYISSDAYIGGGGYFVIKAFSTNKEEEFMDELREYNFKHEECDEEELNNVRPEWYRKTKNSRPDDYLQEYAYVVVSSKLKIYNRGKLIITITKDTAADWTNFAYNFEEIRSQLLYSDDLLSLDWRKEPEIYKELAMMAKEHRPFQTIQSKYRDCYELQDYNHVDAWHTNECPAYQKCLSVTHNDIYRTITFIIRYEKYLKTWHISLQLPWVRVRILNSCSSQAMAMKMLRDYIRSKDPKDVFAFADICKVYEDQVKNLDRPLIDPTTLECKKLCEYDGAVCVLKTMAAAGNISCMSGYFTLERLLSAYGQEYRRTISKQRRAALNGMHGYKILLESGNVCTLHPTRRLSESEMINKETHFGTTADGTWFHLGTIDPDHAKEVLLASMRQHPVSDSLLHAVESDRQLFFCPECNSFYLPDSESGRLIKWFTETAANTEVRFK